MSKVKLNIRNLSVTDLVAKARQIGVALTNNPNFTTPQPSVAEITSSADDLEAAYADAQAAKQASLTKSGTRYWFRVAAVMIGGQSGWSDPAVKMAP